MAKVGVIITTFLRDNLCIEAIQALKKNWLNDYMVFVGNQSYKNVDTQGFLNFVEQVGCNDNDNIFLYKLPYDCGLSYARNLLVEEAYSFGCDYILMMADSLHVTDKYDLSPALNFLKDNKNVGIVGLDIKDRIPWEKDLELVPGNCFYLKIPRRPEVDVYGYRFKPVDICRNFFLAKTRCLLDCRWDEDLKLCEHESFYFRLKSTTDWKVYWTNYISCRYVNYKPTHYQHYRNRMYREYRAKLCNKYNIRNWVKYEKNKE